MSSKNQLGSGVKAGVPIALGYFAVSFSLGIKAASVGMTWYQGFISSILNHASAGEYAVIQTIADNSGYISMALLTIVVNCRYLLMSTALSQRVAPEEKTGHRLLMGFGVTDEIFAVSIAQNGNVNHFYEYGAMLIALPSWALGTALGIIAGNILPESVVLALSVAIYGMFIAIIVPPAKQDKAILILIIISFILSFIFSKISLLSSIPESIRIIILTVLISSLGAILFPVKDNDGEEDGQ